MCVVVSLLILCIHAFIHIDISLPSPLSWKTQPHTQQPHEVCRLPLEQRRKLLKAVIKPKQHLLELIQDKVVEAELEEGRRLEIMAT